MVARPKHAGLKQTGGRALQQRRIAVDCAHQTQQPQETSAQHVESAPLAAPRAWGQACQQAHQHAR